jgi:L,D-peptidoglycan transpeptidase YkuD (ErfK/YbiS/YcfS/YnhG family)
MKLAGSDRFRLRGGAGLRSWRLAGVAAICAMTSVLTVLPGVPSPLASTGVGTAQAATVALPDRLRAIGDARQVIVVTAADWRTSYGSLELWRKRSTGWTKQATFKARLGWSGFNWGTQRRQGDGSTPAGTYTITRAFGLSADPGTDLPYKNVGRGDYWVYDRSCPSTYNTFQRYSSKRCWSTSRAEKLTAYGKQYEAAAIINFNIPSATRRADTAKGGGIFLHVNGPGSTSGCVTLSRRDLLGVLRWLDPDLKPRIVMAPRSAITRA